MRKEWWMEEVVYQIYPKSFCDSNNDGIGDIRGIIERLDYLNDLGVTMLWICPIYKSPMDDNGYDISDYFSLNKEFGKIEDLEELIEEGKKRNIKVILDLVINHTSDEHKWFEEALKDKNSKYHDYYIFKDGAEQINNWRSVFGGSIWEKVKDREELYLHCFGKKQPDLNWENEEVRKELYEMIRFWLDKGIAGFRVDAITFIKKDLSYKSLEKDGVDGLVKCTKTCRNQKGIEKFLNELKRETFEKYGCVTVAEAPGVNYDELGEFIGEEGYFSMIFDFKYADLDVKSGSEWFKRVDWKIKDLKEKIFHSQLEIQKHGWGANFIENHDQPRATSKYLKEKEKNKDAVKMLGAMYFLLRGTPFIYQGQELGMINFKRKGIEDFNDISSIDQYYRAINEGLTVEESLEIINLRSRDNSRTPFPWNSLENGGFSKNTPWLKTSGTEQEINAENQINDKDSILSFYKELIKLRQDSEYSEGLIYGEIQAIETENENVIAYVRKYKENNIYCYFNFDNKDVIEKVSGNKKEIILDNLKENRIILENENLREDRLNKEILENKFILKENQALVWVEGENNGNKNKGL